MLRFLSWLKNLPREIDAAFENLKAELAPNCPGFRVLCPTRWTVRAATMQSVLDNYNVLLALWEESLAGSLDSDMRARILGVEAQMMTFDFIFGVMLSSLLLRHTDNLSASLQKKCMSACQGQHLASLTVSVLKSIRNEEHFNAFFQRVCQEQQRYGVAEPVRKRKLRVPHQFQVGQADLTFPDTPKDEYRRIYFEVVDHILQAVIVTGSTSRDIRRTNGWKI